MVIDVKQSISEKENEFEILYNQKKVYYAKTPFIQISGTFDLEKIREIKVFNLDNSLKYKSSYNYIDNKKEELIPLKYLATKSQMFNQFKFIDESNGDEVSIFFEMKSVWNGFYIIKLQNKFYRCYSVMDKYIRHISIYNDDIQIAELLKPNVIIDGKDTYRIYLKDEYSFLADAISMLALYLDRIEYNSSYLKNKGKQVTKGYSYSKANSYYDCNWVKNNFDSAEYFDSIDKEVIELNKEIKNHAKKILTITGIIWLIAIILVIIILIVVL